MKRFVYGFVVASVCVAGAECQAQSLFGSGGALNSTAVSNASNPFAQATQTGRAMPTTAGSGSRGGTGRATGTGTGAGSQGAMNTADGALGATIGTSGFVGRGDNANRFVGSQNATSNARRGSAANQFSLLQNLVGNNEFNQNGANVPAQNIIPQMRLGFDVETRVIPELRMSIQENLVKLPAIGPRADGVVAHADNAGIVTLSGQVHSEHDRKLIETLVRMEPGVRAVRNELAVSSTP
ncbi:BON domain-containing protein [Planctomicrobium sp. SH527]|uniref:BON domain-containing protein n=1 Tax=Planctomicrobium sp. SH527 TaxID=3448123 RepID=UPI003F5BE607